MEPEIVGSSGVNEFGQGMFLAKIIIIDATNRGNVGYRQRTYLGTTLAVVAVSLPSFCRLFAVLRR